VNWCHEAQEMPSLPVAVVIDGAHVDSSVRSALASSLTIGVAILNGARHATQASCNAVNSAGVHLSLPERLEDLANWLSHLPQLAQLS
jgi:hypothetical protein